LRRQAEHELRDAERHGDEQGHGQAVQPEGVAEGQRDEDADHDGGAALQRREHRCSHRHLHHHDRRERRQHGCRYIGHEAGDPPREPGRKPRLGDRADLCRRGPSPRDGMGDALPQPPNTATRFRHQTWGHRVPAIVGDATRT
jgi:hypothetical protein